jgi:hypothetical protein
VSLTHLGRVGNNLLEHFPKWPYTTNMPRAATPARQQDGSPQVLDLDDRGRISVGKLLAPGVERVFVTRQGDSILIEPAVVARAVVARILANDVLTAEINSAMDDLAAAVPRGEVGRGA